MDGEYYAHSGNGVGLWHPLRRHLQDVSQLASEFAQNFPWQDEAALAGMLHDLGKYGDRFQDRLHGKDSGLDHWSQGAWMALSRDYQALAAALAIQGHHIGLQSMDRSDLRALAQRRAAPSRQFSEANLEMLQSRLAADGLVPMRPQSTVLGSDPAARLDRMLDVRLLFSVLADADFLDTEAHFQGDAQGKRRRLEGALLHADQALAILLEHLSRLEQASESACAVRDARRRLLQDCLAAAEQRTGLFTLTAPTGSGKTLAMLAFALAHAQEHDLHRVIVVIPYLSIIEQTAAIYRDILEPHFGPDYLLEHHSLAGGGRETSETDDEAAGGSSQADERRRRLATENWDAPLIVTTSVQMLESLFANRPAACRKLHRLGRSVILFDEAQTLPAALAVPTLAALSHLAHGYGSSVVFATATQPAFGHLHGAVQAHCAKGWRPTEIVKEPAALFAPLKRTQTIWEPSSRALAWPELAQRLQESPQALCIVNLKRHAQALWQAMDGEAAWLLSTNLCPAHRKDVLDTVRARLKSGQPVYLVATQCIEAGVDVDFPRVFRAYGPLDAVIQAAGRCNREGRQEDLGPVQIFAPALEGNEREFPDSAYAQAAKVTEMLLQRHGAEGMDLHDPDFISAYYRELYAIGKPDNAGNTRRIEHYIQAGAFPEVAQEYRLIQQDAISVVVPYRPFLELFLSLQQAAQRNGLSRGWIRRVRPLAVSLYRPQADDPVWDCLLPVQAHGGNRHAARDEWFILANPEHYHPSLGFLVPKSLNLWIG